MKLFLSSDLVSSESLIISIGDERFKIEAIDEGKVHIAKAVEFNIFSNDLKAPSRTGVFLESEGLANSVRFTSIKLALKVLSESDVNVDQAADDHDYLFCVIEKGESGRILISIPLSAIPASEREILLAPFATANSAQKTVKIPIEKYLVHDEQDKKSDGHVAE
jgi:hypothetical protein